MLLIQNIIVSEAWNYSVETAVDFRFFFSFRHTIHLSLSFVAAVWDANTISFPAAYSLSRDGSSYALWSIPPSTAGI